MPALAQLKNLDPITEKFTTTLDSILERLNELHNTKDPDTGLDTTATRKDNRKIRKK